VEKGKTEKDLGCGGKVRIYEIGMEISFREAVAAGPMFVPGKPPYEYTNAVLALDSLRRGGLAGADRRAAAGVIF
jgi:hypothetical protein